MRIRHHSLIFLLCMGLTAVLAGGCRSTPDAEAPPSRRVIIVAASGGDATTIGEAVAQAGPGDLIRIRGGVYHESVLIETAGLTLEAYDPLAEPVRIDGADQSLAQAPLLFESRGDGVYAAPYDWPGALLTDRGYSTLRGEGDLFQVYEDGELLRGYRNPFDRRFWRGGQPVRLGTERYGLAGPYASPNELFQAKENDCTQDDALAPAVKPQFSTTGRYFYSSEEKLLYVLPARAGDPSAHHYAIPVLPTLIRINAPGVILKNLIFSHTLDYAVTAEHADRGLIDGCCFVGTHYAISIQDTAEFTVAHNVIEEHGFWERYNAADILGTRYGKSCLAIVTSRKEEVITVADNIIRGTPFFFIPQAGRINFSGNIVSYAVLPLFSETPGGSITPATGQDIRVAGNVFHHLDQGLARGRTPGFGGAVRVYRNCIYLPDESLRGISPAAEKTAGLVFYHNTCVFAGDNERRIFPFLPDGVSRSFNNLFYARSFDYTVFVDRGEGRPAPILAGPLLDYNFYSEPLQSGEAIASLFVQGEPYLYLTTSRVGSAKSTARVFAVQ
ncbi:MAG TPA: hypothetical protein ENN69_05630, partial [Spirochaetia bacterium]|nr:hypothetical protein [Spirochaetia bacterium]